MGNLKYENLKNICRMCMSNCDINFNKNSEMLDIFHKLTDVHFETNNELPQQICLECFDFMNEIHSFSVTCKQTHSVLMKCLNDYKNKRTKEEQEIVEETNEQINIKDEITIEEHKIEFVNVEVDNDCETNDLLNEAFDNSTNDLLTPISTYIRTENDKGTINTFNSNDLNNETDSESSTNSISPRNNKKPNVKQNKCKICIETSFKLGSSTSKHKCEHPSVPDISKKLKVKKRVQIGRRSYKCDQCEKSFTRTSNLIRHKRLHSGERPYKCDQCIKTFTESGSLKSHKRLHSGERPYKCDQCQKSFTQSSDLTKHKRLHSGARPYKCDHCEKSFTQSSNLITHKRLHSASI